MEFFIGIDVSMLKLDVTVLFQSENKTQKVDYKVIDNNEKSILFNFLKLNNLLISNKKSSILFV